MIRPSVTVSLVPEAKNGPFVFSGDLAESCRKAAELGFPAVELFLASAETVSTETLKRVLAENGLRVSAVGTGGGFLRHGWTLCSPEPEARENAKSLITELISFAGEIEAPVIIGSMKGSIASGIQPERVFGWLTESLVQLAEWAGSCNTQLLLEPLNRYESNFMNRLEEAVELISSMQTKNLAIIADLFHMNIEEESFSQALRYAAPLLSYLHFVDSNRRAPGFGHLDFEKIACILSEIRYDGYLSAEVLPYPDSAGAAAQVMKTYRELANRIG